MRKNKTYELLLTLGADINVARTTVAGLLSPQIFGASGVQHDSADVLDLRPNGCGKMWDLLNVAQRITVREEGNQRKAVHRRGFVLGLLADWLTDG